MEDRQDVIRRLDHPGYKIPALFNYICALAVVRSRRGEIAINEIV